jgi:hypothetical protein
MALTPHQKRFKVASAAARKKCHKATTTPGTYSSCFGKAMSKALKGKGKKKAAKSASKSKCAGIVKSGPKKGKLKKGYRFKAGKKCPVKA